MGEINFLSSAWKGEHILFVFLWLGVWLRRVLPSSNHVAYRRSSLFHGWVMLHHVDTSFCLFIHWWVLRWFPSWLVWKCSYKHESRSLFNILIMLPGDTHARAGFLGCVVPLILGFWESSVLYFTSPPAMCKRRCLSLHRHQHLTVSHLFFPPCEKTLTMLFWMTWNSPCRSG